MKKETKIFILVIVITVSLVTALDIQTKGKITSLVGSVNPMNLKSSDVPYTNNSQSTVQGAIDDLYIKENTWIDPSTIQTNSTGKIFASSKGIVIRRNGATHFIKVNNWSVEQTHIKSVFSDISCDVDSSYVDCGASDFYCSVYSDGFVSCDDDSDDSRCYVDSDGSVYCT